MLYCALAFLAVALVAGVVGFGGLVGASIGIAQIFFYVFFLLLVISMVAGFFRHT